MCQAQNKPIFNAILWQRIIVKWQSKQINTYAHYLFWNQNVNIVKMFQFEMQAIRDEHEHGNRILWNVG